MGWIQGTMVRIVPLLSLVPPFLYLPEVEGRQTFQNDVGYSRGLQWRRVGWRWQKCCISACMVKMQTSTYVELFGFHPHDSSLSKV